MKMLLGVVCLALFSEAAIAMPVSLDVKADASVGSNGNFAQGSVSSYYSEDPAFTWGNYPVIMNNNKTPEKNVSIWTDFNTGQSGDTIDMDSSCNAYGFVASAYNNNGQLTMLLNQNGDFNPVPGSSVFLTITLSIIGGGTSPAGTGNIYLAKCQFVFPPN